MVTVSGFNYLWCGVFLYYRCDCGCINCNISTEIRAFGYGVLVFCIKHWYDYIFILLGQAKMTENYPTELLALYTVLINGAITILGIVINYLLNLRHRKTEIQEKELGSAKTALEISAMSQERQLQLEKEISSLKLQLENCEGKDEEISNLKIKIADLEIQVQELEECRERIKIIAEHEITIKALKNRLSKKYQLVQEFSLDDPNTVSSKLLEVKIEQG